MRLHTVEVCGPGAQFPAQVDRRTGILIEDLPPKGLDLMSTSRSRRAAAFGACAALGLSLIAAPAAAGDKGLFGSQDPTYDGVYRQGLAVTGLAATKTPVPQSAVRWLLRQQCGNGAFQSYRADTGAPCAKPDPVAYTGRDTNSSAAAAMALVAVGRPDEARAAVAYAFKQQNPDGGFPWFAGADSDTNSTGLVLAALHAVGKSGAPRKQVSRAHTYLERTQLRCAAPRAQRGLMPFQAGLATPDSLGSGQAAVGLLTTLPVTSSRETGTKVSCTGAEENGRADVTQALLGGLVRTLRANGDLMPNSFGDGSDVSASAAAVLALSASGWKPAVARDSLKQIKRQARTYTQTDGQANAGATGTLLLAAGATGANPRAFGGVDLVSRLLDSRR